MQDWQVRQAEEASKLYLWNSLPTVSEHSGGPATPKPPEGTPGRGGVREHESWRGLPSTPTAGAGARAEGGSKSLVQQASSERGREFLEFAAA